MQGRNEASHDAFEDIATEGSALRMSWRSDRRSETELKLGCTTRSRYACTGANQLVERLDEEMSELAVARAAPLGSIRSDMGCQSIAWRNAKKLPVY